jgi:hypothetical protein
MKKFTLLLCLLVAGVIVKAVPISGSFTIPSATYPTIASAFTDLNANGISGPCEFLIDANYTESALSLILAVPTASVDNPITFKKDPAQVGANPKILVLAGSAATTDGGIIIAGTDYVTFDHLDIDASAQSTIEWGYALVKRQNVTPFDGCQHVTIKSCSITLNKSNVKSVGIYSGNHIATATASLSITVPEDACNFNVFYNNTISNTFIGVSLNGFAAATPFTLYDHNNEIGQAGVGKNRIYNFGGANTAAYGIYATNQDLIKIINDSIAGTTGSLNRLAGILLQTGTSSSGEVAYNDISVTSNTTSGQNTYGIWSLFGGTPASNTVSFHDNIIRNCSSTVTTASGSLYGILNSGAAENLNIFNNSFYGLTQSTTGVLHVIRTEAAAVNVNIYNNQIYNNVNNGTGSLTLIYSQNGTNTNIYSNNIYNCTSNGGTVYGIYTALGTNVSVYKNNLYNIESANGSSASSLVYGINNSSTPNITIYNNFISDLRANMATNNPSICGLYLTGGLTNNVYNNTVLLNAVSNGSSFGTAAVYVGTVPTTILRNNIIENVSTAGATGYTVAYRRSSSAIGTYSTTSDNNDFYVGSGPNSMIYFDGTTPYPTINEYKAYVVPADAASFNEPAPFINATTTPFDLHLQTGVLTSCESGGTVVTTPAITDDFDGNPRFPNAGYPNNPGQLATAPDVGADEFAGGPLPATVFKVDMSTCAGFTPGVDQVYLSGSFPGATWNEPGTNPNMLMTRIGVSYIYSLSLTLSSDTYSYKYFKNTGWTGGEWNGGNDRSVTVTGATTLNDTWGGSINWANLQWPGTGSIAPGGAFDVYAQAFIPNGITGAAGATYGLQAWIGYSTENTNPNTWTNWIPAPFFGQSYDNDEFKADLGSVLTSAGTYYYASRFQFGNMDYVYGGFNGGFWNETTNVSGVLTVSVPTKTLNLKALLSGLMAPREGITPPTGTMYEAIDGNTGLPQFGAGIADAVTVQIYDATPTLITEFIGVQLHTDGTASITIPPAYSGNYYVRILSRTHIAVWSATPISFAGSTINYDFTDNWAKAYQFAGNDLEPEKQMSTGVYAMYLGDQDHNTYIDIDDMSTILPDVTNGTVGYVESDIDGYGWVDIDDMGLLVFSVTNGYYEQSPAAGKNTYKHGK